MMTLNKFYKNKIATQAIIPNTLDTSLTFLSDYRQHHSIIDKYIINMKGSRVIEDDLIEETDELTLSNLNGFILSALVTKATQLEHLYNITQLEYNPINNYDKQSTITTIKDKVEVVTNNGAITTTEIKDKKTIQTDYDNEKTTETKDKITENIQFGNEKTSETKDKITKMTIVGESTETNLSDKTTSENIGALYPFNASGFVNTTKNTTTLEGQSANGKITNETTNSGNTTTSTETGSSTGGKIINEIETDEHFTETTTSGSGNNGKIINEIETDEHTTTITETGSGDNGKFENTTTINQNTVTVTTKGTDNNDKIKDTITEITSGNIGTLTTVAMLNEEEHFWKMFSFYDYLIDIVVDSICTMFYE